MSAVALDRVTVALGGRAVVSEVSATVERGEWVALIGRNGAGKTTLLRAVAGLQRHEGSVTLLGASGAALARRERARLVAFVPQEPQTPPWLTVAEYVLLGRTPHLGTLGREGEADRAAATHALVRLDLLELAGRTLGTLSGGERQRVVVARALAQEAQILLLDEPTAALDLGYQQQALELLDALRATAGLTLIAAMHDLTLAAAYADRILLLAGGRIVAEGPTAHVLTEETLAEHYGASVTVTTVAGRVAVLPSRSRASEAPSLHG